MNSKKRSYIIPAVIMSAVALFALLFAGLAEETGNTVLNDEAKAPLIIGPSGSTHHHSTFLIYINGEMRRFDEAKYFEASPHAHIHDYSFAEIHTHAENVTLGLFFETIGIDFNSDCIVFSESESYCNNSSHSLKFFAEGKESNDFGMRKTSDWEHYLITYGDESEEEIKTQVSSVPDPQASRVPEEKVPDKELVF